MHVWPSDDLLWPRRCYMMSVARTPSQDKSLGEVCSILFGQQKDQSKDAGLSVFERVCACAQVCKNVSMNREKKTKKTNRFSPPKTFSAIFVTTSGVFCAPQVKSYTFQGYYSSLELNALYEEQNEENDRFIAILSLWCFLCLSQ